jgi:hypothetical protein
VLNFVSPRLLSRRRHCADCLRSVRCIRDGHIERRNGSGRRRSAQHGASESLGLASDDRLAARGALAQLWKASFTADCVATTEAHLTWSIEANETLGERLTRRALLRQQWRTRGRLVDPKALCERLQRRECLRQRQPVLLELLHRKPHYDSG